MSHTAIRVALDAMGGDRAPAIVIEGAVLAARDLHVDVVLVGPEQRVREELSRHDSSGLSISIANADEVVGMEEHASTALRQKRRSSIAVGIDLVRDGGAHAFVSAGNSGAVMASSLFGLGRIEGIERPAIGTVYPTVTGRCFVLDIGANADCKPEYLAQFAMMGAAYSKLVLGTDNPRVALLSNGEEETKGNALVQAAFPLLRALPLDFTGNVEGKDIPLGAADVVVTDGFSGNIVVKLSEGVAATLFELLKSELTSGLVSKLAALALKPAFRRVKRRLDYVEYGGAPLLGLNGVVVIAHGRSNAEAVKNAVRVARHSVEQGLVEAVRSGAGSAARSERAR